MINEILVILLVIAVVYFVFIKKPAIKSKKETPKAKEPTEEMVECHTCKTYISMSESIIKGGYYYCSDECLEG